MTSTRLLWGPSVSTSAIADEDRALPRFVAGQGYALASYLPRGADAVRAMEETFAPSMDGHLTKGWELFHPHALLFRAGAHWPLLVPLGKKSRRSPEAIQRREQRAKQRAANARSRRQLDFQQANRDGQAPISERWLRLLQRILRNEDDQEGEQAAAQGREAWEDWGHREDWGHWGTWQPSWGSGQWDRNALQWRQF